MPVGLGALRVRLDVVAVLEVLVHDLALGRAHRVERDGALGTHGVGRRFVGLALQRLLAPLTIAGGVDDHAHPGRGRMVTRGGLERQVLDGVDRLAVAADEEPEVVALEGRADLAALLDDVHRGLQRQGLAHMLEQIAHAIGGFAHRRLPDRFFFLRGGAGGAVVGRPLGSTPTFAGSFARPDGFGPLSPPSRGAGLPPPPPPPKPLKPPNNPPPESPGAVAGRSGPRRLRMIICCTIVHTFVVIQYTSRPAGNWMTNVTKTNGSARKIIRCVRSVVVDISSVENSCEPT